MEWKTALSEFRKTVNAHLGERGFAYLGQNQWERPPGVWRGRFAFEITPKDRGASRHVFVSVELVRTVRLSDEEARREPGPGGMPGYVTYAVYSIFYPGGASFEHIIEHKATTPEDLLAYAGALIENFDTEWLPWLLSHGQLGEDDLPGAHRRIELVAERLDYVP